MFTFIFVNSTQISQKLCTCMNFLLNRLVHELHPTPVSAISLIVIGHFAHRCFELKHLPFGLGWFHHGNRLLNLLFHYKFISREWFCWKYSLPTFSEISTAHCIDEKFNQMSFIQGACLFNVFINTHWYKWWIIYRRNFTSHTFI